MSISSQFILLFIFLQIVRRDDSKLWIAYDNIVSKADAVKQASGEEEEVMEEEVVEIKNEEKNGENNEEKKEEGQTTLSPPNKWVMKIVEEIINTFNGNKTLDELIFGPGIYFDLFGPGIYIDLFGPGIYFGELIFEQSFYIDLFGPGIYFE